MKKELILLAFLLSVFFQSCITIQIDKKKEKSEEYLEKASNKLDVEKSRFYYVSKSSNPDFIHNMETSLVSFTKNKQSTSIDKIMVKDENDNEIPLNTCATFTAIDASDIENFLTSEKTYEGIILKSIESQELYDFPENKITTIILYTQKMDAFLDKYLNLVKHLNKEENIDYVFVSMDLENLENISDVWENAIF